MSVTPKPSNTTIDWNKDWNYPLQYLMESEPARHKYHQLIFAVDQAMHGEAVINKFRDEISQRIILEKDAAKRAAAEEACRAIVDVQSDVLRRSVRNRAVQVATGVDRFNYTVNDPYAMLDPELNDRLGSFCMREYIANNMDLKGPAFSRDLDKYGMAAAYMKYNSKSKKAKVLRVHPKNCWWDTKYSATGEERFRAYSEMISWSKLKAMLDPDNGDIIHDGYDVPGKSLFDERTIKGKKGRDGKSRGYITKSEYKNKVLTTLNDLDIYVADMNKLAQTPELASAIADTWPEYRQSLDSCYNASYYQSFATDPEKKTEAGYEGDDVELTTLWDLVNKIEFKLINRRFVICMNEKVMCRKILVEVNDPRSDTIKKFQKTVKLGCPLHYERQDYESGDQFAYPYSLVMHFIPYFDRIIANKSKIATVMNILQKLRIQTDAGNAKELSGKLNYFGAIFTELQGEVGTLNFAYDYTPLQTAIAEDTQEIIDGMAAYTQYDMLQALGDRSTAKEAGMAQEAMAQGVSDHSLVMEHLYASIARMLMLMYVLYSDDDTFGVINQGEYTTVSLQEMVLDSVIDVKTKFAKKIAQKNAAANMLQLAATYQNAEFINHEEFDPYVFEIASMGEMPLSIARRFIKKPEQTAEEKQQAQQEAQSMAAMLQQNQQQYTQDPMAYETNNIASQTSPETQQAIYQQLQAQAQGGGAPTQMTEQEAAQIMAMAGGGTDMSEYGQDGMSQTAGLAGVSPELGSILGNPNSL